MKRTEQLDHLEARAIAAGAFDACSEENEPASKRCSDCTCDTGVPTEIVAHRDVVRRFFRGLHRASSIPDEVFDAVLALENVDRDPDELELEAFLEELADEEPVEALHEALENLADHLLVEDEDEVHEHKWIVVKNERVCRCGETKAIAAAVKAPPLPSAQVQVPPFPMKPCGVCDALTPEPRGVCYPCQLTGRQRNRDGQLALFGAP